MVALLVVAVLSLGAVLLSLDSALSRVHGPSDPAGGYGAVASPAALLDPAGAQAVVAGWRGATDPVTGLSSQQIVSRYASTDVVFAVLLAVLLGVGLHAAGGRAGRPETRLLVAGLAAAYLVADWSETLYLAWVWDQPDDGGPLTSPTEAAMVLIGAFSSAKWLFLGAGLLRIVVVRWSGRRASAVPSRRPAAAAPGRGRPGGG